MGVRDLLGALVAPLLALSQACSALPGYAAPSGGMLDPNAVNRGDLIAYRQLQRSDFKAKQPPRESAAHAIKLGAITCAYLLTTPATTIQLIEKRSGDGESDFTASIKDLGFVAYMDRDCSWWNPAEPASRQAYLLQHEQTHFALTELTARQLNARVPEITAQLTTRGETLEKTQASLSSELEELISDAHDDLLKVNLSFDEATSAKHDPKAQQIWADRVTRQLAALPPARK